MVHSGKVDKTIERADVVVDAGVVPACNGNVLLRSTTNRTMNTNQLKQAACWAVCWVYILGEKRLRRQAPHFLRLKTIEGE